MTKTLAQLEKEKIEIEKQIEELKNKDFVSVECKKLNKEFRIYKWEDKLIKDFPMPKGFEMAEFNDFIYLYDNDLVKLEVWKCYFVKNFSKKQQKKEYCVSGLFLDGDLDLSSRYVSLAFSYDDGRVVVSRELK